MTAAKWAEGRLLSVDTETTGVSPLTDRIVTCAAVTITPDRRPDIVQWILDPGVDIPADPAAVHGWTRDRILATVGAEGMGLRVGDGKKVRVPVDGALGEIAGVVGRAMQAGVPVIAANAVFDLSLLEAELVRHGIDPLSSRPAGVVGVVDPMVIEKQFDPFRKICYRAAGCDRDNDVHTCGGCRGGKHKCGGCGALNKRLGSLCAHYGVPLVAAHDAAGDALAAARLTVKLARLWPQIGTYRLPTLHAHQVTWKAEQSDSLRAFWRKQGDPRWSEVSSAWPLLEGTPTGPVGARQWAGVSA